LVNADLQFAKTEGVTVTAQYIEETINIRRLYQSILSENATSFVAFEDQNALFELVVDLHALTQMTSLAEYQAQEATGISITESDVELVLGAGYAGVYPTVAEFVAEFIGLNRLPVDQYDLQNLVTRDVHIVSLTGYDEFGFDQTDFTPGKFEVQVSELKAAVHVDDLVADEGDMLQLIIDGEVVDELVLNSANLEASTIDMKATDGDFNNNFGLDIVVRTIDLTSGVETVGDVWRQEFG